uniref:Uncharacterized protein n=1 Tax=Anguilla anguilla TaxID=7936 RepID=A0A0E9QYP0_ANGAN
MDKNMWTAEHRTHMCLFNISFQNHGHYYGVGPPLLLEQPPLFWEGFPFNFGTWLWGFASIKPQEY